MTGSLSCPEIVRKSLLSDQLNFTPFATEQLAEHQVLPLTLPWINASIDEVSLDSIRNAACSHLSRHNIPLIERLLHVRNFCTKIDRASKNEQVSLAEELLTLTTELKITALESSSKEKSAELRLNGIDAMTVVCHSLLQLLNAGAHPPLQKVITQAFASYSGVPGQEIEVDSTPQPSITIAQAQTAYLERSVTYGKVIGDQLDKILAQYAIHYWLSEPCVSSRKS